MYVVFSPFTAINAAFALNADERWRLLLRVIFCSFSSENVTIEFSANQPPNRQHLRIAIHPLRANSRPLSTNIVETIGSVIRARFCNRIKTGTD